LEKVYTLIKNANLNIPVTIVDVAPEYSGNPELRAAVNVTMTNTFPFWEGISVEEAVEELQKDLGYLISLPESQNKPFILSETGWPSAGFIENVGIAGPEHQRQYFVESFCRVDVENNWDYYW
jgi:GPH family glycoside/pentoside/hexuronide:cation symporter